MEKYKLTPAEIEDLEKWGVSIEEIDSAHRVMYSYEDWLDPDHSMGLFSLGGWGVKAHFLDEKGVSTKKEYGTLTLFILPESEGRKIEKRKSEILEGFVEAYLCALISWFESRYEQSLEKKILLEKELKRVEKLLFEYNEDFNYSTYSDELWLSFHTYANRKQDSMCYWYERFCVNGEDAKGAVSIRHASMSANELNTSNPEPLHFAVGALAFHRFKGFLEAKLVSGQISSLETYPLYPFFHDAKSLDLALRAALETGLVNEVGKWAHIGEKTKAITMFWRAAVKTGLAKADAPTYKVSKAAEAQFSVHFGQNAIISTKQKKEIADFGEDYKELYKALCEIMRP